MDRYTLFIGYGNSLRRDDGAGLVLATKLATYWRRRGLYVRHLQMQQLTPDLAFDITAADVAAVVFVDAAIAPAGVYVDDEETDSGLTIRIEEVSAESDSAGLGHHMDPSELMVYADLLYRRRPPAWLVAVPGLDFTYGDQLSAPVAKLLKKIDPVAETLLGLLKL